MNNKIKSGKEILNKFFIDIKKMKDLDESVSKELVELYENNEFTHSKIINALSQLREDEINED